MSLYIERKYLSLISSRLRNFKQKKEDLWNFSCPMCGDSTTNKTKARGYVYRRNSSYFYMCHNCNISTNFAKLLKFVDSELFKDFTVDEFINKNPQIKKEEKAVSDTKKVTRKTLKDFEKYNIASLPEGHVAKVYVKNRQIPFEFWKTELFFAENYSAWMNENFPNHGKEKLPEDPRIVMFFTNKNQEIVQVSGRALNVTDNKLRYVTVQICEEKKIFGIHRMMPEKRVYVVEGQFDSLFLPNAVASGDANLMALGEYLYKVHACEDVVLVYDAQPRNRDIVRGIEKSIKNGYKVALLPYDEQAKDINELILNGMSLQDVQCLIDSNIYHGMGGRLKFANWRKC